MFYFDSWNIFVYRVKAWRAGLLAELSVNIRMGKRNGEWAPGYQGGNKYSSGFFPEMMRVTAPVAAVPERQGLPLEKPCRGNVPCAPARLPAVPPMYSTSSRANMPISAVPLPRHARYSRCWKTLPSNCSARRCCSTTARICRAGLARFFFSRQP